MRIRDVLAAAGTALLAACATAEDAAGSAGELAGTSWQLVALQSSDDSVGTARPADPSRYTIELAADGTAALRLNCNRATGRWTSAGPGQVSFGPLAMTRALCAGGSLDGRVAREIGAVRTYVLAGDRLVLNMMADGGDLVWARSSGPPRPR